MARVYPTYLAPSRWSIRQRSSVSGRRVIRQWPSGAPEHPTSRHAALRSKIRLDRIIPTGALVSDIHAVLPYRGRKDRIVVQASGWLRASGSVIMRGSGQAHPDDIILRKPPQRSASTGTSPSSRRGSKVFRSTAALESSSPSSPTCPRGREARNRLSGRQVSPPIITRVFSQFLPRRGWRGV